MSTTTFSGPVKAGNIFNTTGTTLSENVSNQGQATMVQVAAVEEGSADPSWTGIVIPANSQITRIAFLCLSSPGSSWNIGRQDSVSTTQIYFVGAQPMAVGLVEVTTKANNLDVWKDTGALDLHLTLTASSGTGTGVVIVEYIQNNNLVA